MRYLGPVALLVGVLFVTSNCLAENFLSGDKYSEVSILSLEDMKSGYDSGELLIIDVRSEREFDYIQIKTALNLPYADVDFAKKLRKISQQYPNLKIALYGRGVDCLKSYKAAEEATTDMIPNVYAFDQGIVSWVQSYPEETLLQGKELDDSGRQLISAKDLKEKNIDYELFR